MCSAVEPSRSVTQYCTNILQYNSPGCCPELSRHEPDNRHSGCRWMVISDDSKHYKYVLFNLFVITAVTKVWLFRIQSLLLTKIYNGFECDGFQIVVSCFSSGPKPSMWTFLWVCVKRENWEAFVTLLSVVLAQFVPTWMGFKMCRGKHSRNWGSVGVDWFTGSLEVLIGQYKTIPLETPFRPVHFHQSVSTFLTVCGHL